MRLIILILGAFSASLAASHPSEWVRVQEQVDQIDDTVSVYALLGGRDKYIAMGCSEKGNPKSIRVVYRHKAFLGGKSFSAVQYRFDEQKAGEAMWNVAGPDLVAERSDDPLPFILGMKGSSSLYLRVFDYQGTPVNTRFDFIDPSLQIEDMLARCGFTADGQVEKAKP